MTIAAGADLWFLQETSVTNPAVGSHHFLPSLQLSTLLCTSLQTDIHESTSSLNFHRPDVLPDAQPKCQSTEGSTTLICWFANTSFKRKWCERYSTNQLLVIHSPQQSVNLNHQSTVKTGHITRNDNTRKTIIDLTNWKVTAKTRSHPEMVSDMSRVTLNSDLSQIPFVHF